MKAAFLDFATVGSDEVDVSPLQSLTESFDVYDNTPPEEVVDRVAGCDFVYVNKVRFTREIIEQSSDLKFIGLIATGTDNVDLDAAREKQIAVCNIRAYCTHSVVEHVFAVLLSLSHNIGNYHASVRRGDWQNAVDFCMLGFPIRELSAMTIGIVGYGELGSNVARVAESFGMKVIISRRPGTTDGQEDGRLEFEDVLREADVVTLHCPLTAETRGLIGARELELMKPDGFLINTARGGLVDSAALVKALADGVIAGAAIDVLTAEPPVDGDPILDYDGDNLIVTPHIAWATVEARQNAINEVALNVESFLGGGRRNRVV